MKIAICFSGQPRTWDLAYPSWMALIDEIRNTPKFQNEIFEFDCFIHSWNFNTTPLSIISDISAKHQLVNQKELNDLAGLLKPKKMLIEDSEVSNTRKEFIDMQAAKIWQPPHPNGAIISWASPQLYGIMRCAQLKRDYELENNFEYDICVRMRFDSSFTYSNRNVLIRDFNLPINKRTIYSMHSINTDHFPFDIVGDIFFYSDSQTYDILASFYSHLPMLKYDMFRYDVRIEEVFAYYIRMFDIENKRSNLDIKIKRKPNKLI